MNKVDGLHHLAIGTADIKAQIEYFTDVLGMELVALYWMHGVKNTFHGFLRLNDESSIAFVQSPAYKDIPTTIGVTHAGNPAARCAPGTMQHVALKVANDKELLAMRDRIRSRGIPVLGPLDHGFCKSIYFAGPEHLSVELACSDEPINQAAWIDPEVVRLCEISPDELARFTAPAAYSDQGGAVSQPELESSPGPHMTGYPAGVYENLMATPDDVVTATMSEREPPVKV